MIATLASIKMFLCSDGSLKQIPLSFKLGEVQLQEIYELAQEQGWEYESLETRIDKARTMVDLNWATPKDQMLLTLEQQGQAELITGVEYWTALIDDNHAAGIYLNPETHSIEVMVINLEHFTPIHCETVTTLERLRELTCPNNFSPSSRNS